MPRRFDPQRRMTAEAALQHSYFDEPPAPQEVRRHVRGVWDSIVILFSLTEAPLTDPTPTPPNTPEMDPKRTRNAPETEPNRAKRTRTEPNGAEMDRNQALSDATARGVCRDGGGWGL